MSAANALRFVDGQLTDTSPVFDRAVENPYSMRDFHATILHLLGMDQNRLWYPHNGRLEKLTDFGGTVTEEVFS